MVVKNNRSNHQSDGRPEKFLCDRLGCDMYGYKHDRCIRHRIDGNACGMVPLRGQNICKKHGGLQKSQRDAGARRAARADVAKWAAKLVRYDADSDMSPDEILLYQLRWSHQISIAYGEAVEALQSGGLTRFSRDGSEHLAALLDVWQSERVNAARCAKLAVDAGIDQRRVDLAERQAGVLVSVVVQVLTSASLGLSSEQVAVGKGVAAEVMRSLSV